MNRISKSNNYCMHVLPGDMINHGLDSRGRTASSSRASPSELSSSKLAVVGVGVVM